MKKEVRYIADGGKVFSCEEDCLAYEEYQRYIRLKDELLFFDENGKSISYQGSLLEMMENASYFLIKTESAWDFLKDLADTYSSPSPSDYNECGLGLWYYDYYISCNWVLWQDRYNELMEIKNKLDIKID